MRDLSDLLEYERITEIGKNCKAHLRPGGVGVVLVDDIPGRAERYKSKIEKRFPMLEVFEIVPGPVPEVTMLRIRRRVS